MTKLFFFAFIGILISCSPNSSEISEEKEGTTSIPEAGSNENLEAKRRNIDENEANYDLANSLSYRHNDGSLEEVYAILDPNKNILKIEERYTNGKTGNNGKRIFYLENGKKFMSIERFADNEKSNGAYRERVSYYSTDGKVLSTKQRVAQFEEDLEKEKFVEAAKYDCSLKTAEQVLNNEGVFATTFQGFVSAGNLSYILVGGPGETGYASAIAIQYEDDQIKKLRSNEVKYINTPLSVQFEKMVDEKDLEFQVLLSMKILN